jgi:hypothetical protein
MAGLTMSRAMRRGAMETLDDAFATANGADFKATSYRLWLLRPSNARDRLIDHAGLSMRA